nr:chaperonin-containing-TCP1 theta subunit [Cryptomonas sp.]
MSNVNSEMLSPILQEGAKILTGLEQVLFKNIKACSLLKKLISSSFGPDGLNKVLIQKTGKTIVTSDTVTILDNLEHIHPSAKIIALSSLAQEQESGDSAGFVILLATELLNKSYDLIKQGFSISKIIESFEEAQDISLDILETLAEHKVVDISDIKMVASLLSLFVDFGHPGLQCYLAPQIAYACVKSAFPEIKKFSPDNVRVIKILGGNFDQTKTIMGTVVIKDSEGAIKLVNKAIIAIFVCDFGISLPETKSSIMFKSAKEILCYNDDESYNIEEKIKKMSKIGVNVIVSTGFCDVSLFYLNKYKIMAIKIQSRFDLRRIARTCNSIILAKFKIPLMNELGKCDMVSVRAFGLQRVIVFQQEYSQNKIFTIIARSNSTIMLDNIERTVHRTTSVFKLLTRDSRFLPGAGACEIEICRRLTSFASKNYSGYKQYIIKKFAESFEIIPCTLIENNDQPINKTLSALHRRHADGNYFEGININKSSFVNVKEAGIWDSYTSKYWAIKHAIEASLTVLTTSQIIMAKKVKIDEEVEN